MGKKEFLYRGLHLSGAAHWYIYRDEECHLIWRAALSFEGGPEDWDLFNGSEMEEYRGSAF